MHKVGLTLLVSILRATPVVSMLQGPVQIVSMSVFRSVKLELRVFACVFIVSNVELTANNVVEILLTPTKLKLYK